MRSSLPLLFSCLLVVAPRADGDYNQRIEAARATRLDRLTHPGGWLTLIGRLGLSDGASTLGQAPGNRIVLEAGPAHFGTITYSPETGGVAFSPVAEGGVRVDGATATADVELHAGGPGRRPTFVTAGTVGFYVTESGGRKGLVVRNLAHPRLIDFPGLDYYPIDPAWCIEAEWTAFDLPRTVKSTNMHREVSDVITTGKASFRHGGKSFELSPLVNPDGTLLFVFADATSGTDTYPMRFLHAARPEGGKVVLDFNLAENPPCAFSPLAVCPLPPPENRLPLAITAGEKVFLPSHP